MRILIDTHILIWHLEGDGQLTDNHKNHISDPGNEILISIASIWEIAIKTSIGKLSLSKSLDDIIDEIDRSTSSFLPIEPRHAVAVSKLPLHHRDPFDRMLIAQSRVEFLPILTHDKVFANYGLKLL